MLVSEEGRWRSRPFRGTLPRLELTDSARGELCAGRRLGARRPRGLRRGGARVGGRLSIDAGNPFDGLELEGVALYGPTESALRDRGVGTAERALEAGAELVVVTRGERGSAAYTRDGAVVEVEAPAIDAVSTLGAGDVFHGALLAQLVR